MSLAGLESGGWNAGWMVVVDSGQRRHCFGQGLFRDLGRLFSHIGAHHGRLPAEAPTTPGPTGHWPRRRSFVHSAHHRTRLTMRWVVRCFTENMARVSPVCNGQTAMSSLEGVSWREMRETRFLQPRFSWWSGPEKNATLQCCPSYQVQFSEDSGGRWVESTGQKHERAERAFEIFIGASEAATRLASRQR